MVMLLQIIFKLPILSSLKWLLSLLPTNQSQILTKSLFTILSITQTTHVMKHEAGVVYKVAGLIQLPPHVNEIDLKN